MIDVLASSGNKYRKALTGEGLAAFSIIGTDDWQDYASLAYQAMELETALDAEARLESIGATLLRVEALLGQLVASQQQGKENDTERA